MADKVTREQDLERRIEELERRLARGRGSSGAQSAPETAFWAIMHRVFPEDARRHMRAATREQLLTARSYIDRWIAGLEEGNGASREAARHERIEVE